MPNESAPANWVGCKEGRGRRENLFILSRRLYGENLVAAMPRCEAVNELNRSEETQPAFDFEFIHTFYERPLEFGHFC